MSGTDTARVSTFVAVDPSDAFEVFTEEIDLWWRRGARFRFGANGVLRFEAGRLIEELDDGAVYEVGRVLTWEPAARLVFEWRAQSFAKDEVTRVEVRFEPREGGTQVTLEHRGFDALPAKHKLRGGLEGDDFLALIGLYWGDLLTSYRRAATDRDTRAPRSGPDGRGRGSGSA